MKIGITGSRHGMDNVQRVKLQLLLEDRIQYKGESQFHHGNCVGSDEIGAFLAKDLGFWVVAHPPLTDIFESKFTYQVNDEVLAKKPFLDRNHDIVDAVDLLLATPRTSHEVLRSGTWATIRYARRIGRPYIILYPDGSISNKADNPTLD